MASLPTYLKPGVYLVKISSGTPTTDTATTGTTMSAVLKITCDYDVNVHRKLSAENPPLAPELIGYERISD